MADSRNGLNDLTDRPKYRDRSWGETTAKGTERAGRRIAKFDVAIGPAEVAFTYVAFALAGGVVGLIPAVAFRSVLALVLGLPAGVITGLLLTIPARNIRGRRIGIIGATLIALLFSCGACAGIDVISAWQTTKKLEQWGYNPEPLPFAPLLKDEYKGLVRTAMAGGRIAALLVVVTFVVVAIIVLRRQRQHP